jgi:hypothetical protein
MGFFIMDMIKKYKSKNMRNFIPDKNTDFFSAEYQSEKLKTLFENLIG